MIAEFHYSVAWRSTGIHPGHHPSMQAGGGHDFIGYTSFLANPDPRNLDLRASLRNPLEQPMARNFRQRGDIPVYVLADLSASLNFGAVPKIDTLAIFTASVAYSAYRSGDRFGFIGCDDTIRWDLYMPLRFHKNAAPELLQRLGNHATVGRSANGLLEAVPHLGRQRALIFLLSDFHFDTQDLECLLRALIRHDVIPVVLWHGGEYKRLPTWGLACLEDPETGQRRRILMRPSLREKFRQNFARRREALMHICTRHGREPFFILDRFDADALTRYFHQS